MIRPRQHYPNPHPPIGGGAGKKNNGGNKGGGGGGGHDRRTRLIGQALSNLQGALVSRGFDAQQALTFAKVLLTRPGVTITNTGVRYKGAKYTAADFATTHLADFVTGVKAKNDNEAAIKGESGYLADLANLGLNKSTAEAGLQQQYDQSILNYGDPAFAGSNSILGASAAANPFSQRALLQQQYNRANQAAAEAAAMRGTASGGGYQAALGQNQQAYAGQTTAGVQSLQDILSALDQQRAQAEAAYNTGNQNALLAAQQRLLASGQIHAAAPPTLHIGSFNIYHPPKPPKPPGGGRDLGGRPPLNHPTGTRYPRPNPPHLGGTPRPPRPPGVR